MNMNVYSMHNGPRLTKGSFVSNDGMKYPTTSLLTTSKSTKSTLPQNSHSFFLQELRRLQAANNNIQIETRSNTFLNFNNTNDRQNLRVRSSVPANNHHYENDFSLYLGSYPECKSERESIGERNFETFMDEPHQRLLRSRPQAIRPEPVKTRATKWLEDGLQPQNLSTVVPSKGSELHGSGVLNKDHLPCAFSLKARGCLLEERCPYCHLCGPADLALWKKMQKKIRNAERNNKKTRGDPLNRISIA